MLVTYHKKWRDHGKGNRFISLPIFSLLRDFTDLRENLLLEGIPPGRAMFNQLGALINDVRRGGSRKTDGHIILRKPT